MVDVEAKADRVEREPLRERDITRCVLLNLRLELGQATLSWTPVEPTGAAVSADVTIVA